MTAAGGQGPIAEQNDQGPPARTIVLDPASYVFIVVGFLLAAAIFGLVRSATDSLTTIAVGSVFALALDPVVRAIHRNWGWPRQRAVMLVVGGVIVLVATVVVVLAPQAVRQAQKISTDLPETVREFYSLPLVGGWLERNDAATEVDQALQDLPAQISDESVTRTVETLIGGALTAVLVLAITIAVLLDGERLVAGVRRNLPSRWVSRADEIGRIFYVATAQYFGGSLAVAALMGIYVLSICLIFGVPLAPLAAIWATIASLIPQIGGFLTGSLIGLLALTQGPVVFVVVLGLFLLYMNLENHVISPAVIGSAVDITPPTAMLAAIIGGTAAGVPGALVATPLVGAIKQLYLQLRFGQQPFAEERPRIGDRVRRLLRRRSPRR